MRVYLRFIVFLGSISRWKSEGVSTLERRALTRSSGLDSEGAETAEARSVRRVRSFLWWWSGSEYEILMGEAEGEGIGRKRGGAVVVRREMEAMADGSGA